MVLNLVAPGACSVHNNCILELQGLISMLMSLKINKHLSEIRLFIARLSTQWHWLYWLCRSTQLWLVNVYASWRIKAKKENHAYLLNKCSLLCRSFSTRSLNYNNEMRSEKVQAEIKITQLRLSDSNVELTMSYNTSGQGCYCIIVPIFIFCV